MKKAIQTILIPFLLSIFLAGCTQYEALADNSAPEKKNGIEQEMGTLNISFPGQDRTLTLDQAKAAADFYEVVVYNTDLKGNVNSVSGTVSISLPAGTYNLIGLAGVKSTIEGQKIAALLGTGITKDVVVTANNTTNVNLTLSNIDFDLDTPAEVNCGESFNVPCESTETGEVTQRSHQSIRLAWTLKRLVFRG